MQYPVNSRRPKSGDTKRVWDIGDEITAQSGRKASRGEVIERAVREGIHGGTASKQYNDWRLDYEKRRAASGFDEAPVLPLHISLTVQPDGRVLLPAELRRAMKLGEDGRLTAHLVDGELRLISPAVAIEKLQAYARANDKGTGSAVDELIAERRAEAARE